MRSDPVHGLNYRWRCLLCMGETAWAYATYPKIHRCHCLVNPVVPALCEVCEATDPSLFRRNKRRCMACDRAWWRAKKKGQTWGVFVKARREHYLRLAEREEART